jgi:hypothetical protein
MFKERTMTVDEMIRELNEQIAFYRKEIAEFDAMDPEDIDQTDVYEINDTQRRLALAQQKLSELTHFTVQVCIPNLGYYPDDAEVPVIDWQKIELMSGMNFHYMEAHFGKFFTKSYMEKNLMMGVCRALGYKVELLDNNL